MSLKVVPIRPEQKVKEIQPMESIENVNHVEESATPTTELSVFEMDGQAVIDSREVAAWIGVEHKNLLTSIRGYGFAIAAASLDKNSRLKIQPSDFFIESSFENRGKNYPCYLLTRKGCEMVANKMTGEKGVLFTAAYIERFHEYEERLKQSTPTLSPSEMLLAMAQNAVNLEKRVETAEKRVEKVENVHAIIADAFLTDAEDARQELQRKVREIAKLRGGNSYIETVWQDVYATLNVTGECNVKKRRDNIRKRMEKSGAPQAKVNAVSMLDAVMQDQRLIAILDGILNKMLLAYAIK